MKKIDDIIGCPSLKNNKIDEWYQVVNIDGFIKLKNLTTGKTSCNFPNVETLEEYTKDWIIKK